MRAVLLIVLVVIVQAVRFNGLVIAADKDRPFGEPPPPGRHMEERPFGGPPPKHRGQQPPPETQYGKKCRTQLKTCQLAKQQPVGDKCTCGTAQGAVME